VRRGSEDAPRLAWSLGYSSEFLSSYHKHVELVALWLVVACERQAVFCHSAKGDPSANNLIGRRLAALEAHDVVKGAWWPVTITFANWPNRHRHVVDLPFSNVNLDSIKRISHSSRKVGFLWNI